MSEKLLSERDAYELADILNAKGIDKFAEMAENIAHNQAIEAVLEWFNNHDGIWDDDMVREALRKKVSE